MAFPQISISPGPPDSQETPHFPERPSYPAAPQESHADRRNGEAEDSAAHDTRVAEDDEVHPIVKCFQRVVVKMKDIVIWLGPPTAFMIMHCVSLLLSFVLSVLVYKESVRYDKRSTDASKPTRERNMALAFSIAVFAFDLIGYVTIVALSRKTLDRDTRVNLMYLFTGCIFNSVGILLVYIASQSVISNMDAETPIPTTNDTPWNVLIMYSLVSLIIPLIPMLACRASRET